MPREANLFEITNGNVFEAYFLIKQSSANIPPQWIERSRKTRKAKEEILGKLLEKKSIDAVLPLKEWNEHYRKECFYRGLRILLELERNGSSRL